MMMFKSLNGLAPVYLHELFSERYTDYNANFCKRFPSSLFKSRYIQVWTEMIQSSHYECQSYF